MGAGFTSEIKRIPTLAAWVDLLGYGALLREANVDLEGPRLLPALRRLQIFQASLRAYTDASAATLVVNDGAVCVRDIEEDPKQKQFVDFIQGVALAHYAASAEDHRLGHCGMRTVVCEGVRYQLGNDRSLDLNALDMRMKREYPAVEPPEDEEASFEKWSPWIDALNDCSSKLGVLHYLAVEQLQFNFAFTRAYCADGAGKAGGLVGSRFFLELPLYEKLARVLGPLASIENEHAYPFLPSVAASRPLRCIPGSIRVAPGAKAISVNVDKLKTSIQFMPMEVRFYRTRLVSTKEILRARKLGQELKPEYLDGEDPPWF